jgi:large subunit ribosomal protein L25
MKRIDFEVKLRKEKGKAVKKLRQQGLVPAVVYGRGMDSLSLEVDAKKFRKLISGEAGLNVIINLKIADNGKSQTIPAITHTVAWDPISDNIEHIDFHLIRMDEKIKTKIHIELTGEPPIGVKDDGGVLVHEMREVEIKCLPDNIPANFIVDVANLKIGESVHVSSLNVPSGVEVLADPENTIVTVSAPSKEEAAPAEAAVPVAGEVAAEGAAPAGTEATAETKDAGSAKEQKAVPKEQKAAPKEQKK